MNLRSLASRGPHAHRNQESCKTAPCAGFVKDDLHGFLPRKQQIMQHL